MKKIILFIILGCLSLYGFSVNPIDPPIKSDDNVVTITPTAPVTTDECSDFYSVVGVTAVVTILDCPDYDCSLPGPNCTCVICIYDNSSCSGTPLGCSGAWDPNTCTYYIRVQANENTWLFASFACHNCSYGNGCIRGDIQVPSGGGDVPFSDLKVCAN